MNDRHGCHDKPGRRDTLEVQDGWTRDGRRRMVEILDRGSPECRHESKADDPKCEGCRHRDHIQAR